MDGRYRRWTDWASSGDRVSVWGCIAALDCEGLSCPGACPVEVAVVVAAVAVGADGPLVGPRGLASSSVHF